MKAIIQLFSNQKEDVVAEMEATEIYGDEILEMDEDELQSYFSRDIELLEIDAIYGKVKIIH